MDQLNKVLSLSWTRFMKDEKTDDSFLNELVLFWKGHKIQIKIHSYWGKGPGGFRTNYEFIINGEIHHFKMLDSYMKGTIGDIPKIQSDDHQLIFKVMPTAIEIIEEKLS